MRRTLLIAVLLVLPLAAWALSWNATFEAQPANTDPAGEGDDRIRELKNEIRDRAEVELCWGSTTANNCAAADNGRARAGSARIFMQNAAPTALPYGDRSGSVALDAGRCWVDLDGADNVAGNEDDNILKCTTGAAAWVTAGIGAWGINNLNDVMIAAPTENEYMRYDGTKWANSPTLAAQLDAADFYDEAINSSSPTEIDVEHGTGTGGRAGVTIPATGDWSIEIYVDSDICFDGATQQAAAVELVQNPASDNLVLREIKMANGAAGTNTQMPWSMHYVIPSASVTNNGTYEFTIRAEADSAGVSIADPDCETGTSGSGTRANDGRMTVIARPYNGIR